MEKFFHLQKFTFFGGNNAKHTLERGKELTMKIKSKILDAEAKKNEWAKACNTPTALKKTGKTKEEAIGLHEFYEGRFDILMEILKEGEDTLSQQTLSIKQYEAETKIKTWTARCSNPEQLIASGRSAEDAAKLIKYFEGKQSVLAELGKEI